MNKLQTITLDEMMREIQDKYYTGYDEDEKEIYIIDCEDIKEILSKYFPREPINPDKIQDESVDNNKLIENPVKKIEKLSGEKVKYCSEHFDKINELIDAVNELRGVK